MAVQHSDARLTAFFLFTATSRKDGETMASASVCSCERLLACCACRKHGCSTAATQAAAAVPASPAGGPDEAATTATARAPLILSHARTHLPSLVSAVMTVFPFPFDHFERLKHKNFPRGAPPRTPPGLPPRTPAGARAPDPPPVTIMHAWSRPPVVDQGLVHDPVVVQG